MPTPSVASEVTHGDLLVQPLLAAGDEQHHQNADEREEHPDAQQPVLISECFHAFPYTFTMTSTTAPMAAAPKSRAPYWLTRPDCTGRNDSPVSVAT